MKCYNCGKLEEIANGYSNIDMIETDSLILGEDELYMPLCEDCEKMSRKGELGNIEEKWIQESNKNEYIDLIEEYGDTDSEDSIESINNALDARAHWKWVNIRWEGDDNFIHFERHTIEEVWGKDVYEALENLRIVVDKHVRSYL